MATTALPLYYLAYLSATITTVINYEINRDARSFQCLLCSAMVKLSEIQLVHR